MSDIPGLLRSTQFAARVDVNRRRSMLAYDPWPPAVPAAADQVGQVLWNLLHLGVAAPGPVDAGVAGGLTELGLADGNLGPGAWELTAFRGVLGVRDRSGGAAARVYVGEDSLRFVETILQARPGGRAMDVGCGSGITTCALARSCDEVVAVDLQEVCLSATRLAAVLGGVAGRVRTWHGDFRRYPTAGEPLNCVAANLPYVPVPPALDYAPAGDGGPDGLDPNRRLLALAPGLLDPVDGILITRFQSLGDASGPLLLPEIRRFAQASRHDVAVVVDGRMPRDVRSAITAVHASRRTGTPARELLYRIDEHLHQFALPHFYACGLVSRSGGSGTVTVTDLSGRDLLDTGVRLGARPVVDAVEERYRALARDLPDGFWELGAVDDVRAPLRRFPRLVDAVAAGGTVREVTDRVFADRFAADPVRARALYVTTELMVGCLADGGLVDTWQH